MTKKIQIICACSLALNLFLVGFISGKGFRKMQMHPPINHEMTGGRFAQKEEALIAALPTEKQQQAREVFKNLREIRESNFSKNKITFSELENLVTANIFEQEKFLQSIGNLGQSMSDTKKESDIIVAKFLADLTQQERINLLKTFKELHSREFGNPPQPPKPIDGQMPQ